jgi:hypothetical protein
LAPFFFGKQLSDNFFWTFLLSEHGTALQLASAKEMEKKRSLRDTNKRCGLPY